MILGFLLVLLIHAISVTDFDLYVISWALGALNQFK